jgi:Ca2+-binding EF-hand superfamily protein
VSESCKDLLVHMLAVRPEARAAAPDVLSCRWLREASPMPLPHVVAGFAMLRTTKLQRVCLGAMQQFLVHETSGIDGLFIKLDTTADGVISRDELRHYIASAQESPLWPAASFSALDLEVLFEQLDFDNDGRVSKEEFRVAALAQRHEVISGALRPVFTQLDVDRSGFISGTEIATSCAQLAASAKESRISLSQAEVLLRGHDISGDGALDFDEFCHMMMGACARAPDTEWFGKHSFKQVQDDEQCWMWLLGGFSACLPRPGRA